MMKVMSENLLQLRFSWLIFLLALLATLYVFKPFINGLGCEFTREYESENYYKKGFCSKGIMVVESKDKVTGAIKIKKFLWGHWQGYNYTLRINTKTFNNPTFHPTRMLSLYDVTLIVSAYRIPFDKQDSKSALLYDKPFELVYVTDGVGKLGYI